MMRGIMVVAQSGDSNLNGRLTMFAPPHQSGKCASRRGRIVVSFLAALALGIPALNWLTADDELSDEQVTEKPAGASKRNAAPIEYFPRPTKYDVKIIEALDKPTRIEVADLPLEKCVDYLKDHHKISIWLDRAAFTDEGGALDQPVTLKLAGVALRSVLKLLLEPMQLK